ncbi:MAG TPA: pyrimidine-nucleoside phosphorylase [Acholeplasma sp.]|jgi:pyrimidine-nucleoside phosphorylase|nr:pyrimidine-nucleoside phosphorylase [Acholeplasmatales bacterium]HHV33859.1 pyrimidine-nucleoside phosphorylase [Acholeplasma sp.]
MRMVDLIIKKREKQELTKEEISFIIEGFTNKSIPNYQMSAFLMAVYFNGMTDEESTNMALAMMNSGDVFDLSSIEGIKVDKHSTGGVGDKVSIVLGPLMAACGAKFAKMSGRGLGHTGGTLDKLESIKGFNIEMSEKDFIKQVNEIGLAIIGQSDNITPADKYIYALRDVTGTVPAIPLIASSIMSKKLASGANAICLDVKVGSGAFLETITEAKKLAELMVNIGNLAGRKMSAIITSMDEPLGNNIGNALEVKEAIEMLKGGGPEDLKIVVYEICKQLLIAAEITCEKEAEALLDEKISSGEAFNKLVEMVVAQGGDKEVILNPELLPTAKYKIPFIAYKSGFIEEMDTEQIGVAGMLLGAGRRTLDDEIDMAVGLEFVNKVGAYVNKDDVICYLHANSKNVEQSLKILQEAIKIGKNKRVLKLIEGVIK